MFPPAFRQEPVFGTRHEFRPVCQRDSMRRLNGLPVRQDGRAREPTIMAAVFRPEDFVSFPQMRQGTRRAISHQNKSVPGHAIGTAMLASTIWVDAVAERNVRTVVLRHDAAGPLQEELRPWVRCLFRIIVWNVFAPQRQEAIGRVNVGAAARQGETLRHGPSPVWLGRSKDSRSDARNARLEDGKATDTSPGGPGKTSAAETARAGRGRAAGRAV